MEKDRRLVLEDIRFFISRLSNESTGTNGLNFLPSKVEEMGRRWEERHKEQK